MIKNERLHKILKDLHQITGVGDIGYHKLWDGKLHPVFKIDDQLPDENWRDFHESEPVKIEDVWVLQEVIKTKNYLCIQDIDNYANPPEAFKKLNIKSALIIPTIKNNQVEGIIVIASIGKKHLFTEEEINKCLNIVIPMHWKMSDAIIKLLSNNIDNLKIYGVPSGTVHALYDSTLNFPEVTTRFFTNEAGAMYAAEAYARTSGNVGVCMMGGVGVGNTMNGFRKAYQSHTPLLLISGDTSTKTHGRGDIQEIRTVEMTFYSVDYSIESINPNTVLNDFKSILKMIFMVNPKTIDIPKVYHISVPIDIQNKPFEGTLDMVNKIETQVIFSPQYNKKRTKECISEAIELINASENGIIMVGRGARNQTKKIIQLSRKLQWPIITTPGGKGVIPGNEPMNLGNYGFASTDAALKRVRQKYPNECLLILGTSCGGASTLNFHPTLYDDRKVIQVDHNFHKLSKAFKADIEILSDLSVVLDEFLSKTNTKKSSYISPVIINEPYQKPFTGFSLRSFFEQLPGLLPDNIYYVSDIGSITNYPLKFLKLPKGSNFEVDLNYATMGSGVAGSIGIHDAFPNMKTIAICGDGSFLMNGMEILTAKKYNLPIVFIVANNSKWGYVDEGHKRLCGRTIPEFSHNYIPIAKWMKMAGINTLEIHDNSQIYEVQEAIMNMQNEPLLIELIIDGNEPIPSDRFEALKTK